jgi:hypothetical protein
VLDGGRLNQLALSVLDGDAAGDELGGKATGNLDHLPGTVRPPRSRELQFPH